MLSFVYSSQFKKDMRLAKKRGKDLTKIKKLMDLLLEGETLSPRHRDHWLEGTYVSRRECHIEPDWLMIYKPMPEKIIFERTGTHSDLFR
jgi:mRNA interferase YafQ